MPAFRLLCISACVLSSSVTAWSPAAPVHLRTVQSSRSAVRRHRTAPQPVAVLGAGALRREGAALLAATPLAPARPLLQSASLFLKLLASTLCSVLCFATRAYAAERLKTAPSTAAAAPLVLTGDVIKWGGLAAVFGAAYMFRKEEAPILTETVVDEVVPSAPAAVEGDAAPTEGDAPIDMMSDLRKRMQQLAEEREAAEAAAQDDAPADDSTDEWGTGNTAVLEPPKPDQPPPSSLLEDGPVVDFPVGFPLRDMEESPAQEPLEPSEPTATQDQIEMLERMFGTRGNDA